MKTTFFTVTLLFIGLISFAQMKSPAPSPAATVKQTVGLTEISVEYSRPSAKGRTIFGDLVPFGEKWRTGANKNSMVTFEHGVTVKGTEVPAGSYAIFTLPSEKSWTIYLYSDTENWGTPEIWDETKVAAQLVINSMPCADKIETMRFSFENITNSSTDLVLAWENTSIAIPIVTKADEMTMENITKALAGPGYNEFYQAAKYYRTEGKDMAKAKEWITKAADLAGPDKYWVLREKSLVYAASGDVKGAIAAANASKASAEKAGNMDYVRMNDTSLKEWMKKK